MVIRSACKSLSNLVYSTVNGWVYGDYITLAGVPGVAQVNKKTIKRIIFFSLHNS